jgi:hypothetical protein
MPLLTKGASPANGRLCSSGLLSAVRMVAKPEKQPIRDPFDLQRLSSRLPTSENDDRSYCCGAGVGVPPNQPAAYAITSNTTITATTPYQRRLSLRSIVTSRYPAMRKPQGEFEQDLAMIASTAADKCERLQVHGMALRSPQPSQVQRLVGKPPSPPRSNAHQVGGIVRNHAAHGLRTAALATAVIPLSSGYHGSERYLGSLENNKSLTPVQSGAI